MSFPGKVSLDVVVVIVWLDDVLRESGEGSEEWWELSWDEETEGANAACCRRR